MGKYKEIDGEEFYSDLIPFDTRAEATERAKTEEHYLATDVIKLGFKLKQRIAKLKGKYIIFSNATVRNCNNYYRKLEGKNPL